MKVHAFNEHPREHDGLGELNATDQQLTDTHLHHATTIYRTCTRRRRKGTAPVALTERRRGAAGEWHKNILCLETTKVSLIKFAE